MGNGSKAATPAVSAGASRDSEPKAHPIVFTAGSAVKILAGIKTQTRRIVTAPRVQGSPRGVGRMVYDLGGAFADPGFPDADGAERCGYLHVPFAHPHDAHHPRSEWAKDRVYAPWSPGDLLWVREPWRVVEFPVDDALVVQFRDGAKMEARDEEFASGARPWRRYLNWWSRVAGQSAEECLKAGLKLRDDETFAPFPPEGPPTRWRSPRFMPRWCSRTTLRIESVRAERLREISEADAKAEGVTPEAIDCVSGEELRVAFRYLWERLHGKPGTRWSDDPWVWVVTFSLVECEARPRPTEEVRP